MSDPAAGLDAGGHGGGWLANSLSALAFIFSGFSFYMSALQQADLDVFVPPVLQYGRDGGGDVDVFAVPITISNGGANTGTVLALELVVENLKTDAEPKTKTFYSAFMGEHPKSGDTPNKTFAPISLAGRGTFSDTIRFYPQGNPLPKIIDEPGDLKFTLKLQLAQSPEPSLLDRIIAPRTPDPLVFSRTLPYLPWQHVNQRRGTISMHAKDWKPTASSTK